jgi:hypothetical protein
MANHYISQSGAGTQDGSSAANARAVSWLNTSGNWSGIAAGDFIRLVGTISSPITVYGSGSAGNPITIRFETGAKMSAPAWVSAAITGTSRHYITIDGGATGNIGGVNGNPAGANGIIEATDNGVGLGSDEVGGAIYFYQSNHLTITGLVCQNIYVRAAGDAYDSRKPGTIIANIGDSANYTDFTVTNCVLNNGEKGIYSDFGSGSSPAPARYTFTDNTISHVNWGIAVGGRGEDSYIDGIEIARNWVYDVRAWDDPGDGSHHDLIFIHAKHGVSAPTNVKIYSNKLGPHFGTDSTAAIFFPVNGAASVEIFNNLIIDESGTGIPSDGHMVIAPGDGSVVRIYNNTMIGNGGTAMNPGGLFSSFYTADPPVSDAFDTYIYNNLVVGKTAVWGSFGLIPTEVDRNLLFFPPSGQDYALTAGGDFSNRTFSQWQALGYDTNGIYGEDPLLTETYRLGAGSPAIGAGENLSAFFSTDADGNARPAEGAWDIGAYQFDEIPVPLAGPRAPARRLISGIFF